ncbi:MAG TPA: ABC transporter substrate-binding protein [Usitatibacter sp.]|nr:ABC transporter substrate-binding protein [Usitatibacter sp.]
MNADARRARWRCVLLLCALLALGTTHAADPRKVIRIAVTSAERGFDCARESDEFTGELCDNIFDALLQYDHLARPIRLQPRAAVALPEVADDGRTYTLHVQPGIYFTPDPAFEGRQRELVAADYVYSLKRLIDPKVRAQWAFLLEGKLVGGDELAAEAKKTGRFDYDRPLPGLEAVDRYTLRIRLKEPDYNLPYILTMPATAAMAREVVERYGEGVAEHPVGTGPFRLGAWRRSARVVLEANPGYRENYFTTAGGEDERDAAIARHLEGKRLPLVGRVQIDVIEEHQPRWLAFLDNEHDYLRPLPVEFLDVAMPGGQLAPNLARRGISVRPDEIAWITYTTFNMRDPIVGGYTPEKIALRRAICLGYPVGEEIATIYKNQAIKVDSPIAPGMAGYTPETSPTLVYDPARAKALLDMYGYVDRDGDGFREMPDGSPLVIDQASTPEQRSRQRNELWRRAMEAIGIRMTFDKVEKLPDLRRQAQLGRVQSFTYGWIADYPDGENFLQLFWSKSIGGANYSLFSLPEYDALYEKVKVMPDSPERTELYRRMVRILWVYAPWRVNSLMRNAILIHPWVIGYKKHPFAHEPWRYVDIDLDRLPTQ